MSESFNLKDHSDKNLKSSRFKFHRPSKSKLFKIIPLFIIALAIPMTIILALQNQDNRNYAAESGNEKSKVVGYIIEFHSPPVSLTDKKSKLTKNQLINEEKRIENDQEIVKKDILQKLGKKYFNDKEESEDSIKQNGKLKYTINGIALGISAEQAEKVKSLPNVKNVYPDLEVKSSIMESVPLIGVTDVWQSLKDNEGNALTGKDINIGILDTGINYVHQDLGGTNIVERNFNQINNSQSYNVPYTNTFSLNQDRIAYFSGPINVINIKTGEKRTINTNDLGNPSGIFLKNNYLAYLINSTLYYYDLNLNQEFTIGSLSTYEKFAVGDKKIVYSNRANNIFYDLETKVKTTVTRPFGDNPASFVVSGNNFGYFSGSVASNMSGNYCFSKFVVQDMDTLSKTEYSIPNLGNLLDYDGSKILYNSCANASDLGYKIYDLSSGQITSLSSTAPSIKYPFNLNKGELAEGLAVFTNPIFIIQAFDMQKNRTVRINAFKKAIQIQAQGNNICFSSDDSFIYCHAYDPNFEYFYPNTVFNSKVVGGYDFYNSDDDPYDDHYHGTHVAGIAAGNGILKGVAPDANIFTYKVLGSADGAGSTSTVMQGIDAAISTRIDNDLSNDISIINLSLGSNCETYTANCGPDDILSKSIDKASSYGIVSVIAAGNSGSFPGTIASPATARTAISVGAVDKNKTVPGFSSRGPVTYNQEIINKPDVVAPGVDICSAGNQFAIKLGAPSCVDDLHIKLYGTSMAAPHVAGLAALILQAHPDWTPQQVKDAIINNADNLGFDKNTQGAGLVNAKKIFNITPSPTPTLSPIPTNTPSLVPTNVPTYTLTPTLTPALSISPTPTILKLTLNPGADSFVRSSSPTTNFGTNVNLENDLSPDEISYLRFNLATLAGKTIKSAKLILTVSDPTNSSLNLRRADDKDWTEAGITYNNRPGFVTTITSFNAKTNGTKITLDVRGAVDAKKGSRVTFGIKATSDDSGAFYSRQAATASNRPQLIVEYQ